MRLRNNQLKSYGFYKRTVTKDNEGNRVVDYEYHSDIRADIHPVSGQIEATMYGEKLKYMLEMIYSGSVDISEGDAVAISDVADYKVVSIKEYRNFRVMELERL